MSSALVLPSNYASSEPNAARAAAGVQRDKNFKVPNQIVIPGKDGQPDFTWNIMPDGPKAADGTKLKKKNHDIVVNVNSITSFPARSREVRELVPVTSYAWLIGWFYLGPAMVAESLAEVKNVSCASLSRRHSVVRIPGTCQLARAAKLRHHLFRKIESFRWRKDSACIRTSWRERRKNRSCRRGLCAPARSLPDALEFMYRLLSACHSTSTWNAA